MEEPLYTEIDPEAVDRLFKTSRGRVTFKYLGYEVVVEQTGQVELVPLDQP